MTRLHGHDPGAINAPTMSKTTIAILGAGALPSGPALA